MCTNDNLPTTRAIVSDYFNWRLNDQAITNNRLFILVRKIAYDCETTYSSEQPSFNFHFSILSLNNLKNIHYQIGKELFNDGIITWTRILSFISFSAILTERFIQQQQNMNLIISSMIDWTTKFIDTELQTWLKDQNYWAGCLKIYDKIPERRNSISRYAGLLGTIGMLTLGALYIKRI